MMIKHIFQKEPVLSIATCLAIISAFFVPPDAEYLGYIDFRTLAILFSLMTVMAGLRGQGVFDRLGHALLSHTRTTLQLTVVLGALAVVQRLAQHLVAAADAQHRRAACRQFQQRGLQSGLPQPKQVTHRVFRAGQND